MTKTKSMDQVWGPNSTTPFPSLFDFLVPPLLKANYDELRDIMNKFRLRACEEK